MEINPFSVIRVGACTGSLYSALNFFHEGFRSIDVGNTHLKRYYLYDDSNIPYLALAGRIARGDENSTFLFAVASLDKAKCEEVVRDFQRGTWLKLVEPKHPSQIAPQFEMHRQLGNYFMSARENVDLAKLLVGK